MFSDEIRNVWRRFPYAWQLQTTNSSRGKPLSDFRRVPPSNGSRYCSIRRDYARMASELIDNIQDKHATSNPFHGSSFKWKTLSMKKKYRCLIDSSRCRENQILICFLHFETNACKTKASIHGKLHFEAFFYWF